MAKTAFRRLCMARRLDRSEAMQKSSRRSTRPPRKKRMHGFAARLYIIHRDVATRGSYVTLYSRLPASRLHFVPSHSLYDIFLRNLAPIDRASVGHFRRPGCRALVAILLPRGYAISDLAIRLRICISRGYAHATLAV